MTAARRPVRQVELVGRKIRRLRKERKLTQNELAARIGIQQSDLSRMEKGEYRVSLDTLFKILAEFDISIGEFFDEMAKDTFTPQDVKLVREFRSLEQDDQDEVRDFIQFKRHHPATIARNRRARGLKDEGTPSMMSQERKALARGRRALAEGVRHAKAGRLERASKSFARAEAVGTERADEGMEDRARVFRIAVEMEMGMRAGPGGDAAARPPAQPRPRGLLLRRLQHRALLRPRALLSAKRRSTPARRCVGPAPPAAPTARRWPTTCSATCIWSSASSKRRRTGYERALELMPAAPRIERALVLDNLGYCHLVLGELKDGFTLLYESLRMLSRLDAQDLRPRPRLSLAFGYLEIGRFDYAARQAQTALDEARRAGDETSIKNALYLLGQTYNLEGDEARARDCFCELQRTFYPDNGAIPDFLLAIDVRRIIHLKA